jgi:hypothetical protein
MFAQRLSPSGHIPLDEGTLQEMSKQERDFWEGFLEKVSDLLDKLSDAEAPRPYAIPVELQDSFRTAVGQYDGDKYCQMSQLRTIFDCHELPAPPSVLQVRSGCLH